MKRRSNGIPSNGATVEMQGVSLRDASKAILIESGDPLKGGRA